MKNVVDVTNLKKNVIKLMYKIFINPQDVCDLLNELLKLDYECISNLIKHGEECNKQIEEHKVVQVKDIKDVDGTMFPALGVLGIINGLFKCDKTNTGAICYETEDGENDKIVCFRLTDNYKKWLEG